MGFIKRLPAMLLPDYARYIISLLLVLLATYMKFVLFNLIGPQTPFLLYFAVLILCSRWLGYGPALSALMLSTLAVNYFFMEPFWQFQINKMQVLPLALFIGEGYLVIHISRALNNSLKMNVADQAMYKAIMERSSDAVVVVDARGKRSYCSPSVKNVLGYTDEEYLNMPPWQLGHPDELHDIKDKYEKLIQNPGSSIVMLHRMKHKNGHWIWVESRVTNYSEDVQLKSAIANFNDVTERIEIEQSRKDFIGIVSHELKSPLTSMNAYGQLLLKKLDVKNDPSLASLAEKLVTQMGRMNRIISNLLDVTTINAGRMQLNLSEFDFNALVAEVLENLQQTTDKHSLRDLLCPVKLITADRERISQVMINLIANAIKYSPDGGLITVLSIKDGDELRISVTDQGIGIPKNDLDKVFNRMYRVNNTGSVKGLGLGLFLCQQIVRLHGGVIGVESEDGTGSEFWFRLPLKPLIP
jgi:PAS domain S-box-containing protein